MITPVLFITFNRPLLTERVLKAIREKKPKKFFIFQDGPRLNNDTDIIKCNEVRDVINKYIDWDCELYTYYPDKNLGCGPGPSSAISWFFENVEMGIIIEDDALPSNDFFEYAEQLLIRYKSNFRVRAIGSMTVENKMYGESSYYFSMMNRTLCAWATWKRAWVNFDYYLRHVTEKQLIYALSKYGATLREREYWCARLIEIQKDGLGDTSWDQQFWMSIWLNNGIGISPNKNLSSNIGFNSDATHTTNRDSIAANRKLDKVLPLVHPNDQLVFRKADLRFHKLYFEPYEYGLIGLKRLPFRINKRLKKLFNHSGSWLK